MISKTLVEKYGDIQIFNVDELQVRNSSLENEEFSNYGIHSDFPKLIPKLEIWISEEIKPPSEKQLIIQEALNRIKFEWQGLSEDDAYYKATDKEKVERGKLLHSRLNHHLTKEKPDDLVYIKKLNNLSKISNLEVYLVNGDIVRDLFKTDFVEGGNGYVYSFIPLKEIWIEDEVPEQERILILIHEVTESNLMKNQHMKYEKAHIIASKYEWQERSKLFNNTTDNT